MGMRGLGKGWECLLKREAGNTGSKQEFKCYNAWTVANLDDIYALFVAHYQLYKPSEYQSG